MKRFFRAIVVFGVLATLAQSAIALTSRQRNDHFTEMLSNIGAVAMSCGFTPDFGYGTICAVYPKSGVAFPQDWELNASSKSKVSVTAQRISPWQFRNAALLSTFVTADDDEYVVMVAENNNLTAIMAIWPSLPSDGNAARLGSLGKTLNASIPTQPSGTNPSVSPATPSAVMPPATTQTAIPPLSPPPRPPTTVSLATPVLNPDLVTLEKYVQDNSLLYQGFVAGTTTQGAFSSRQNVFFLIALGEKFLGSAIVLKVADELQATLSLGTQTMTLKKR